MLKKIFAAGLAVGSLVAEAAWAQTFPTRPIIVIVPFTAGAACLAQR